MTAHQAPAGVRRRWPTLLLVAFVGCGPSQRFFHDARYTPDGAAIEMAALMPNCGCVSITSVARPPAEPTLDEGTGVIEIVASFHGAELGVTRLAAGQSERVKYDWAGADDPDRYLLSAYAVTGEGRRGARLTPISRYVELGLQTESRCRESTCAFNLLHMDRAVHGTIAQGEVGRRQQGVDFTSGGQLLGAVASPQKCGCMVIQNINPERSTVHVQATFSGQLMGRLDIPWVPDVAQQPVRLLGFDWGGPLARETYVLSVIGLGELPGGVAPAPPAGSVSQRLLRIQDYVNVLGQMDQLDCAPDGAVMWLPLPTDATTPPAGTTRETGYPVTCSFDTIHMNRMAKVLRPGATEVPEAPAADAPGIRRQP